jgi:hypothetical protein
MTKQFPKVAKMSTLWNAGWNAGLQGQAFHSRSLGKKVHSQREEETIMRSKGFIPESDFGKHFIDDPQVAGRSGLQIGTPGDALAWVRQQLGAG